MINRTDRINTFLSQKNKVVGMLSNVVSVISLSSQLYNMKLFKLEDGTKQPIEYEVSDGGCMQHMG